MLSQRAHYAMRAMIILAANGDDPPLRTWQIANAMNLSPKFLETILLSLRKAGILRSYRGCKGGFLLARPAREITFADIVQVTDGSLALSACVYETGGSPCVDCFGESHCEIRRALITARDATTEALKSYDFASVAGRLRDGGLLTAIKNSMLAEIH